MIRPVSWQDGGLSILDQTRLPGEEAYLLCSQVEQVADAIRSLQIRGAPLIGIAAAYGIALAAHGDQDQLDERVARAAALLRSTRPTARNLFWALDRMVARARQGAGARELLAEAEAIHREDADACRLIGEHGATLLPQGAGVLTICNTGSLATGGIGTALGVIRTARSRGNPIAVLACETRPLLQGARLTMWELTRDRIPATLITDGMAGALMQQGAIDLVIAGADRIACNGDAANKIGTYSLAVLARHHGIPFYVAAPLSTVDTSLASGKDIPIEERGPEEVRGFGGVLTTPEGTSVRNPAFDVTPGDLIDGIVTERGVMRPPYHRALQEAR
jgi:methylthioribose-1-phosphate isomerase